MRLPLRVQHEAKAELADALSWYEERRPGLGGRFLAAIDETLDRLQTFPSSGAPVESIPAEVGVRRLPIRRFPYQVVYLCHQDEIEILAFAHDRRRPRYWRSRIEPVR